MRERLDMRGVDRNVGIEEMRQPDPERFRCQTKRVAIAVECVAATRRDLRDPALVLALEDPVTRPSGSFRLPRRGPAHRRARR